MDCAQLKSIVSLVDSLVRNTQVRRSRMLPSNQVSVGEPSLAPVSSKSLTDFSICSILGLEPEITQSPSSSGKLRVPSSDPSRALSWGHHLAVLITAITIRNQFLSSFPSTILFHLGKRKRRILNLRQEISIVRTGQQSGIMKKLIYLNQKLSVGINWLWYVD